MIPLHPTASEILGLDEGPMTIGCRGCVPPRLNEAPSMRATRLPLGPLSLLLLGVTSSEAASLPEQGGLFYVENRCIGETTRRRDVRRIRA